MKLIFLCQTTYARLYRHHAPAGGQASGRQQWVPLSVIKHCDKPEITQRGDIHEVTIADWWLEQNPWVPKPSAQAELL